MRNTHGHVALDGVRGRPTRRAWPLALGASLALLAGFGMTGGAVAADAAPPAIPGPALVSAGPPPSDELDLTVVLRPSDRAALRALAGRSGRLSATARKLDLARLAPTTGARSVVVAAVRAAGMTVTSQSAWAIQVRAATSAAESLFGVGLVHSGGLLHPNRQPTVPAGLRGIVTTVLGLDQRPIAHPRALPIGYGPVDLRSAYRVSAGGSTGAGATIATVQFSGWNSSDLVNYSQAVGQPVPPVTQISVDGASPGTPDGSGGEQEVALDHEMIAAGAPGASQRVYFAPNTAQGFYDVFDAIATDASTTPIAAVSTSWGECESSTSAGFESSVQDAIDRAVAAGATTFAASGDQGAYDCPSSTSSTPTPDVDFPAVLPEVIGVGGTTLSNQSGSFAETAWSDAAQGQGGGGGASTRTPRPSYQQAVGITGSTRLVPDVSAVADPRTGVGVYVDSAGGYRVFGGTSAASPLTAAEFVSTLAGLGCTRGIGDIHAALYAHPEGFRDITSGTNLLYSATPGYDEATGLGSPNWIALAPHLPTAGSCGTKYTPVPPARVFSGTVGTIPQVVTMAGRGGIAANATAVVVNVEVENPTATGYVRTTPAGSDPQVASQEFTQGTTISNLVTVKLTAGQLQVKLSAGSGTVFMDVEGYYSADTTASTYTPLTNVRVFGNTVGTTPVVVPLAGANGVPANAAAVVFNAEVENPTASGYIRVTPAGQDPRVAAQEFTRGETISAMITSQLSQGDVQVKLSAGSGTVFLDVTGYYSPSATGSMFVPTDTSRSSAGPVSASPRQTALAGATTVPDGATAVVVNAEIDAPTSAGYLRITPAGTDPSVATQEFTAGQTLSNLQIATLGSGAVQAKLSDGSATLYLDTAGYFVPVPR